MAKEFFAVDNGEQLDMFTREERESLRKENEKDSFIERLRVAADDKSIVCITVQTNELKELALSFFIRRGFYCVQNDTVVSIDYSQNKTPSMEECIYYVLTFAKDNRADRFIH